MGNSEPLIHSFNKPPAHASSQFNLVTVASILVVAALLGLGSGYGLLFFSNSSSTLVMNNKSAISGKPVASSAGLKDTKTFPDKAEGTLREGGVEGEGSFHLERPGGESQNVYLTSSTVDLSGFIGKKVSVLGKTYEAQHAGWLMDVGYIEVMK